MYGCYDPTIEIAADAKTQSRRIASAYVEAGDVVNVTAVGLGRMQTNHPYGAEMQRIGQGARNAVWKPVPGAYTHLHEDDQSLAASVRCGQSCESSLSRDG